MERIRGRQMRAMARLVLRVAEEEEEEEEEWVGVQSDHVRVD